MASAVDSNGQKHPQPHQEDCGSHTAELARQHGHALAKAVQDVLAGAMQEFAKNELAGVQDSLEAAIRSKLGSHSKGLEQNMAGLGELGGTFAPA